MASEHDIGKAFLRFERVGLHIALQADLFETLEEQRQAIADEWYELFQYVETTLFNAAVPIVLKNCTFWPKPVEMMNAIDAARRELAAPGQKRDDKAAAPVRELDPETKAMISRVMASHSFAERMEIEQEVIDAARSYFPQIGEKLIRENYCEFRQLADQRKAMQADSFGQVMQGRCLVPRLDSRGFVILSVAPIGSSEKRGAA